MSTQRDKGKKTSDRVIKLPASLYHLSSLEEEPFKEKDILQVLNNSHGFVTLSDRF